MGRNRFYFIAKDIVPRDKRVTYARLACAIRPQKKETHRVRLIAGGNLVDYPGNTSTPTAGIVTIKTHWNSVVSKPNHKYCTKGGEFVAWETRLKAKPKEPYVMEITLSS